MTNAAEAYECLRTPAFKAVMRELLAAGTWVHRAELQGCDALRGGSLVALENALADVVMVGLVEFRPEAGYRIKQPALARQAGRELSKRPDLDRFYLSRQRDGQVDVGVAMRMADGDVALCSMKVPEPQGAGVQWTVDAVVASWNGGGGDARKG